MDELLFKVLTGRGSPEDAAAVATWRSHSPANNERYESLAMALGLAAQADAARVGPTSIPRVEDLLKRSAGDTASETTPNSVARPVHRSQALGRALPWAAALVLVLGLSLVWHGSAERPDFGVQEVATSPGETATVVFGDGTVVRLGPQSRLQMLEGQTGRRVTLRGTAYFAVARDEQEPFLIRTPAGEVRVLGTRFDLSAGSDDLRVRVVEGQLVMTVEQYEETLEAGQIGRVVEGRALPTQTVDDPAAQIDWLGSFLAFQGTPLPEAAREIGRAYGISVELTDSALAERTVTSHFADWALPNLIEALCLIVHADCVLEGDVVRMVSRQLP